MVRAMRAGGVLLQSCLWKARPRARQVAVDNVLRGLKLYRASYLEGFVSTNYQTLFANQLTCVYRTTYTGEENMVRKGKS